MVDLHFLLAFLPDFEYSWAHAQPLSYRHRTITDEDLVFIRSLIAAHPASSRWDLSKKLCEAWNWVQPNGALRDMVCRGMMLMLDRAGLIELPPERQAPRQHNGKRSKPAILQQEKGARIGLF